MAKVWSAKEVRQSLELEIRRKVEDLHLKRIIPAIALFRVGDHPDDVSYELGIEKKFKQYEMNVVKYVFDENVSFEEFRAAILEASSSEEIHGILLFQPLASRLCYDKIRNLIPAVKDIEGIGDYNMAGLFTDAQINTYCAPAAIMKFFEFYRTDLVGKHVVLLGRGQTVGKPLTMMLINAHATVTVCNSKTENLKELTKSADILISAMGRKHMIDREYVREGQIVVDAGTVYEGGKLYGDVDVESVREIVQALTPTPDGISSLTTDMLAMNLLNAIARSDRFSHGKA